MATDANKAVWKALRHFEQYRGIADGEYIDFA
ncbi:MAG: hypothetical protein KatS3mg111_1500 [Pirellulaceae bacterium]|nr:MAG: hypothetical protein KatS3mg111_1500 [Pirellulaceae bacterium]